MQTHDFHKRIMNPSYLLLPVACASTKKKKKDINIAATLEVCLITHREHTFTSCIVKNKIAKSFNVLLYTLRFYCFACFSADRVKKNYIIALSCKQQQKRKKKQTRYLLDCPTAFLSTLFLLSFIVPAYAIVIMSGLIRYGRHLPSSTRFSRFI